MGRAARVSRDEEERERKKARNEPFFCVMSVFVGNISTTPRGVSKLGFLEYP
jgi:hypothetical protein